MVYQIKIKGNLDQSWVDWLGDIKMTSVAIEDGTEITTLTLDVTDQPALFGILDRIRDLNIALLSVTSDESWKKGV